MPQDEHTRPRRPVPPNLAFPRVWTLFDALITVRVDAENVADALGAIEREQAELIKRTERTVYDEPPEYSRRKLEPAAIVEINARRALLEGDKDLSNVERLLAEDVETLAAKASLGERYRSARPSRWKGWSLLDRYARHRHELREAIKFARTASAAAAPDIDPQGAGLERPSTKILTALAVMGGALPDEMQGERLDHLKDPSLYRGQVLAAIGGVQAFINQLRADAHREAVAQECRAMPPVSTSPPEDARTLNTAEHALMLQVSDFLANHPQERNAAAGRLESKINPDAVRKYLQDQQESAARRYDEEARVARSKGDSEWADELERRARCHRSTWIPSEDGWIRTAGKLGALAESFAASPPPTGEMSIEVAYDALFLIWCVWTQNTDLGIVGCPSLAGANGENPARHALDDLISNGGPVNVFGLRRPFETARRALAELESSVGLQTRDSLHSPSFPPKADREQIASIRPTFEHAEDFTWIIFEGVTFHFAKGNQAESIRHLWAQFKKGGAGHGLSEKTIGQKIESSNNSFRLAHVFRSHSAWGTLIRSVGRGVFALCSLESPKNHTS